MSQVAPPENLELDHGTKTPSGIEAKIYGESAYDRVSSMLLAVVLGALIVVGWLSIIAATTSAYQARVTQPIEVIEVSGGGGGTPEGKQASVEEINVAGGEAAEKASNNEEEATEFEEPSVENRPAAMLDTVTENRQRQASIKDRQRRTRLRIGSGRWRSPSRRSLEHRLQDRPVRRRIRPTARLLRRRTRDPERQFTRLRLEFLGPAANPSKRLRGRR